MAHSYPEGIFIFKKRSLCILWVAARLFYLNYHTLRTHLEEIDKSTQNTDLVQPAFYQRTDMAFLCKRKKW